VAPQPFRSVDIPVPASAPPGLDTASIAKALPAGSCAVGFHRSTRPTAAPGSRSRPAGKDGLLALVLHADGRVSRVELGPIEPIAAAVTRWREAIGEPLPRPARVAKPVDGSARARDAQARAVRERGEELRKLVLDPVLAAAGDVSRLFVCPDDALHLVPLEALPLDSEGRLVGERVEIASVVSFADLLLPHAAGASNPTLLTVGAFDSSVASGGAPVRSLSPPRLDEEHGVEDVFNSTFHGKEELIAGAGATRAAFLERSPTASFIHVATDGWFGTGNASSLVHAGVAPRVRVEGAFTDEELSHLDLSRCEMAVLSASESLVGALRAGQEMESPCAAAHRAGARAVLGSLWKVDGTAAAELMPRFYSHLWVEKQPAARALWCAKMEMRKTGRPLRDWAGWVIVGAPD
jgi:CHAT domain-containing protein